MGGGGDPVLRIWNFYLDPKLQLRNQPKMIDQINKKIISNFRPVNSGLCVLKDCRMKQEMADSWYRRFFFLIEFKVCYFINFQKCLNKLDWFRNSKNSQLRLEESTKKSTNSKQAIPICLEITDTYTTEKINMQQYEINAQYVRNAPTNLLVTC